MYTLNWWYSFLNNFCKTLLSFVNLPMEDVHNYLISLFLIQGTKFYTLHKIP